MVDQELRENIIVTGSSGMIGSALIERIGDRYRVFGFDRTESSKPPPQAERILMDLTSDESVEAGLRQVQESAGNRIASVVHLAAFYDFSGEPSPMYDEVTVRGTERLVRALKRMGFEVEQFIFSSTMLVHAPTEPGQPMNEEWPIEPKWPYPESKVQTEQLLRDLRGDTSLVLARIAGVYTDRLESIPIAQQIQRIYERQLVGRVFPGDTSHGQAFLHLDDLIDAFARMIVRRHQLLEEVELLLGEPETPSYDELQRMISRHLHGEEWETREIPKAVAKTGAWVQDVAPVGEEPFIKPWMIDLADDHYDLDISRARQLLDWEPKRSLREVLPRILDWVQREPDTFYEVNNLDSAS
jgi:nucleoside-diphosphate-sugar epimerase